MSNERMKTIDMEKNQERERTGKFIGRLRKLGLGNPEGIPSSYAEMSDEALQDIAEKASERLVEPTDLTATACIDGRRTLGNADDSAPEIRLRRVGGSASNLGVALNAEALVIDTLSSTKNFSEQIEIVDTYVTDTTGFQRSAHLGGCGGAMGEIEDHEAISRNPKILEAVQTLMEIPEVKEYFGVGYNGVIGEQVRKNSEATAALLRAKGWDGAAYVEAVKNENPRCVEDLEVDPNDKKFHGHKERSLKIIIGDKTDDGKDDFVWNLKASKAVAKAFQGRRGKDGYTQALIAEVAKHIAVANRLPSVETPILLLTA